MEYGIVVNSLNRQQLVARKYYCIGNMLKFKGMLLTPKEKRIGKLTDEELLTLIEMDSNTVAIIEMAISYLEVLGHPQSTYEIYV